MDDRAQRRKMEQTRCLANGLLAFMAVLLAVLHWIDWPHPLAASATAFVEAALVGGLADWFAVTALFRHPFGVPVPHTAILPANQKRLADSIAEFVEHNFLTNEVISLEAADIDFAKLACDWLSRRAHRRWLARQMLTAAAEVAPGPLLATLTEALVTRQLHERVFDQLIDQLVGFLDDHQSQIYGKVLDKSPRWMPRRVNNEFFLRLMEGLAELLAEMRAPGSDARQRFEQVWRERAQWLRTPDGSALTREIAAPLLVARTLARPLEAALASLAERLARDADGQAALNQRARLLLTKLAVGQRQHIAGLARRVVLSWDAVTLVGRLEQHVGRDLQFIRINGTLVGGLVGLLLHAARTSVF